jgi:uncharacterized protein (DUF934 family)
MMERTKGRGFSRAPLVTEPKDFETRLRAKSYSFFIVSIN